MPGRTQGDQVLGEGLGGTDSFKVAKRHQHSRTVSYDELHQMGLARAVDEYHKMIVSKKSCGMTSFCGGSKRFCMIRLLLCLAFRPFPTFLRPECVICGCKTAWRTLVARLMKQSAALLVPLAVSFCLMPDQYPLVMPLWGRCVVLGMVVMEDGDGPTTTTTEEEEELSLGEDSSPMQTGIQGVEQKIENLYQSSYFFSGKGRQDDWDVFADTCVFADEFSSFVGTCRFRRNVTNFGKFLENPECTLTKLERVQEDDGTLSIRASWIFRSRVKWINGLLAAAGETTYVLDGDRVVRHDEAWKTPKSTVFKNIFFNRSQ